MVFFLYTDGATSNNGYENSRGGWAAALYEGQSQEPLFSVSGPVPNSTNNICEMKAIINGLAQIKTYFSLHFTAIPLIVVMTDSAYIYNCYAQQWYKKWQANGWRNAKREPVANQELWEQLIPYFENPLYKFEKTKGHADDARNNYVDKLAVAAKEM